MSNRFVPAMILTVSLWMWGPVALRGQTTQSKPPATTADAELESAGEGLSVAAKKQAADATETESSEASAASAAASDRRTVTRATLLVGSFTVFLLAIFVGFEVITKVPPTLHTPLMSGSNAISGITIVGAMLTAGSAAGWFGSFLGMLAVILATVNVVGGFLVTHRMLMMFKKR